jgi:hypothetical protein
MNDTHVPDRWVIVKINNNYKVFATWLGGYLDSDCWRLNSGIVKVELVDEYYLFYGYSGSIYKCHCSTYGTSNWTGSVLDDMLEKVKATSDVTVEMLSSDVDFLKLIL